MKTIKQIFTLLFVFTAIISCNEDFMEETDFGIVAPSNVGANFEITQDNTGLVTITPTGDNVISFDDPESSALKENITCLMLQANNEQFKTHYVLEASLFHYVDVDDDKFPEEFDDTKLEKPLLKVVGLS